MKKIITAAILIISILLPITSFALSSYGITSTTDSSQNIWTSCFPKNPTFLGAFTTTAVCFTTSSGGGINGHSSAPVSIFDFVWNFMAGINVSGTSTLQSANITSQTLSGALTFSAGSYMTSTITSGQFTVIPSYGIVASAISTTINAAIFANGTTDCGFSESLNYCYIEDSPICNIILPPICYASSPLQNTIPQLRFVQIGGESSSDVSIIIPIATMPYVLSTDNYIRDVSNIIFYNAYNQNIGTWITQTSAYHTYNNIIFVGNTLTASVVFYQPNIAEWEGFSTIINNCNINNTNTTAPYGVYAYSAAPVYGDDQEPITIENSTIKEAISFIGQPSGGLPVRMINNYTNNGGVASNWILQGLANSEFSFVYGSGATININSSTNISFDHTAGIDHFIIDSASQQIRLTDCYDNNNSNIAQLSITNNSPMPVILDNCIPSGTVTGLINEQNGNTFTGGVHADALTATSFTSGIAGIDITFPNGDYINHTGFNAGP